MSFKVEILKDGGAAIVRFRGRLVLGCGATVLRQAVRRALSRNHRVAIDLRPVTQMYAHGTGVLAELCANAQKKGRLLLLAGTNDRVQRLLRLTRLDGVMPQVKSPAMSRCFASAQLSSV